MNAGIIDPKISVKSNLSIENIFGTKIMSQIVSKIVRIAESPK